MKNKFNFKSIILTLTLLTLSVGQMWAGQGYNGESHVYLNVNGTTKYYKVSTESWSTGSSLPGTWGGVLKNQTFNNVLYIQVKGGAVGGWTENGGNISGTLYYKVTNNTTTPSSGWTTVGNINANLKFDDNGQPMSTASGNTADIVCDYGDFLLSVEVTMQTGQRQYEMEGEPVSRHLAKLKKEQDKEAFCFFIAPKINDACIAHFYTLHLTNISYYGGKSVIIPLELSVFEKMVEQSGKASYEPNSEQVRRLCQYSMKVAQSASSEAEWYQAIRNKALNWLTA